MNIRRTRNWAARLLLAVFIPMVLLSATHRHSHTYGGSSSCEECVKHIPHAGHLLPHDNHVNDCVLCQFVQMTFLTAAATVLLPVHRTVQSYCRPHLRYTDILQSRPSSRAPPFVA